LNEFGRMLSQPAGGRLPSLNLPGETRQHNRNIFQKSQRHYKDLNHGPSADKCRWLPLHQPARCHNFS